MTSGSISISSSAGTSAAASSSSPTGFREGRASRRARGTANRSKIMIDSQDDRSPGLSWRLYFTERLVLWRWEGGGDGRHQVVKRVAVRAVGHDDDAEVLIGVDPHHVPEAGAGAVVLEVGVGAGGFAEPAGGVVEGSAGGDDGSHAAGCVAAEGSNAVELSVV